MIKASIIVVNNRPNYHFPEAAKESWLEIIVIENTNPCWARNQGAKQAKGKYLVFLDNDVRVKKGWLDKVIVYLDKNPQVGAGQLKLLRMNDYNLRGERSSHLGGVYDSAGDLLTSSGFLAERAREAEDKGQFDKTAKIFSGKGAAMAVRKEVFEKINGFDESYIYYWEEPDLFWRVWRLGYEVRFLWMGKAYHAYGTKLKPIPKIPAAKIVYLSCRNQIKTIVKNAPDQYRNKMLFWVILAWISLGVVFFIKGKWRQTGAVIKALLFRSGSSFRSGTVVNDQWMKQVMVKQNLSWYLGKGVAYVTGKPF